MFPHNRPNHLTKRVECRAIFEEVMGSISCLKVIRPSGSSLELVRLEWERVHKGGPGACSPGKFSFSKMHIRAFSERINVKMNENYGENAHARDSRYQMSKD